MLGERAYTQSVRNDFYDLIENDLDHIWSSLKKRSQAIGEGNWKPYYEEIVSRYRLSCRFAVMRILFEQATGLSPARTDEKLLAKGFAVDGVGDFPDITMEHAERMDASELARYRELLLRRASENEPDYLDEAKDLIDRALALPARGLKCALSRDEIIRLGHMAGFGFEDMQFLLLRVLGDNETGFRYSSSEDLVDIYGFIVYCPLSEVEALKSWYAALPARANQNGVEEKPAFFTRDIADSVERIFLEWAPEERTERFKSWLRDKAPSLDAKPETAQRVYANLAAYTLIRIRDAKYIECLERDFGIRGFHNLPDEASDSFYNDIEEIASYKTYQEHTRTLFFTNGKPDAGKCAAAAEALCREYGESARNFGTVCDNSAKYWRAPYLEKGRVKLDTRVRERLCGILADKLSPCKSDMLFLLWVAANSHWHGTDASAAEKAIFMDDFLDAAECLLRSALLPEFYPPNILEESMLLSIALGCDDHAESGVSRAQDAHAVLRDSGKAAPGGENEYIFITDDDDTHSPAAVYESICASFAKKGTGGKTAGARNKTKAEKRKIAEYYRDNIQNYQSRKACAEACAKRFGVGRASVENYFKALQAGEL